MLNKTLLFLFAAALSVAPAAAQDDDLVNKIISNPSPGSYQVQGARIVSRVRSDAKVQGGKALRVEVPGKGANNWDVAVAVPVLKPIKKGDPLVLKPIKKGDPLVLAFWARLEKGENGATTATLPHNTVQITSAPYSSLMAGPAEIGPEWKMHQVQGKADKDYAVGTVGIILVVLALHLVQGKADKDYAVGTVGISLHLATAKQVVDVGPVFLLDMGQP